MKAMILAAGLGTRMRPLTLTTPKPLLPVGGQPLIVWHIMALKAAGITDIVINAAYLADTLMRAIGDGSAYGVRISWSVETEPLETAGGIIQALPYLGDNPFILVNGDIWTPFDFAPLMQLAQTIDGHTHQGHLCLVTNPEHNPNGDFYLQDNYVLSTSDSDTACKYTFAGISVLHPNLFNQLPTGKAPLAPILRNTMAQGAITGELLDTLWVDVGTIERLQWLDNYITTHYQPLSPRLTPIV